MGDESLQGIGHLLFEVPNMPEKCYPCTCTNLLPMYPDYTAGRSNKPMQPTAISADFMRKT